jgi:hypothetical protein
VKTDCSLNASNKIKQTNNIQHLQGLQQILNFDQQVPNTQGSTAIEKSNVIDSSCFDSTGTSTLHGKKLQAASVTICRDLNNPNAK